MAATTLSWLELEQDAGWARAAFLKGPVFITDAGVTTHVLLGIEEYRRLSGNLAEQFLPDS